MPVRVDSLFEEHVQWAINKFQVDNEICQATNNRQQKPSALSRLCIHKAIVWSLRFFHLVMFLFIAPPPLLLLLLLISIRMCSQHKVYILSSMHHTIIIIHVRLTSNSFLHFYSKSEDEEEEWRRMRRKMMIKWCKLLKRQKSNQIKSFLIHKLIASRAMSRPYHHT